MPAIDTGYEDAVSRTGSKIDDESARIDALSGDMDSMQASMDSEIARVQVSIQEIEARQKRGAVVRFAIAGSMLFTTILLAMMLTPAAGSPAVRVFAVVAIVLQVVVVACSAVGTRM